MASPDNQPNFNRTEFTPIQEREEITPICGEAESQVLALLSAMTEGKLKNAHTRLNNCDVNHPDTGEVFRVRALKKGKIGHLHFGASSSLSLDYPFTGYLIFPTKLIEFSHAQDFDIKLIQPKKATHVALRPLRTDPTLEPAIYECYMEKGSQIENTLKEKGYLPTLIHLLKILKLSIDENEFAKNAQNYQSWIDRWY